MPRENRCPRCAAGERYYWRCPKCSRVNDEDPDTMIPVCAGCDFTDFVTNVSAYHEGTRFTEERPANARDMDAG